MIKIHANKFLNKLDELMNLVADDFIKCSADQFCTKPKEGMEIEYHRYKKMVKLIQQTKNYIYFNKI